jgi:hypothetical protein
MTTQASKQFKLFVTAIDIYLRHSLNDVMQRCDKTKTLMREAPNGQDSSLATFLEDQVNTLTTEVLMESKSYDKPMSMHIMATLALLENVENLVTRFSKLSNGLRHIRKEREAARKAAHNHAMLPVA